MLDDAVIVSACRTPIGRFQGALSALRAPELGAIAVREALARAGVAPDEVDQVALGNVLTAGVGQNPARQASMLAGVPPEVPAFGVNEVCGSGLKAVALAAQAIRCGDAKIAVAGGQESMSNAPYLLPKARGGFRLGDQAAVDSLIHDGLLDAYHGVHMGETGEIVAERFGVTREDADRFASESHARAAHASECGAFAAEIVPVGLADGRTVERDEGIRPSSTIEALARLKPAFREAGVVTAGNASQISDGASALVIASAREAERRRLPVLARIVAHDDSATRPEWVMEAPIASVRRMLERAHVALDEVELFEHNEAFATASCAVRKELGIPDDRFNVNGGAIALGHPIGASGARVLTTLLHALRARRGRRGVATLCLGGGGAVSLLVEAL
ncbi:MAG TPA: acetyl-CoA C-acyltransferase [Candidatus Binatia bacterium]|nr:acetyl-CoA C-acyltransferase [Candidatus Binatia bacterium]